MVPVSLGGVVVVVAAVAVVGIDMAGVGIDVADVGIAVAEVVAKQHLVEFEKQISICESKRMISALKQNT